MAKRLLVICTLLCLDLFVFVLIYESNVEDSVKASTTFYENVIALTFDDGPHGTYTKELLEGLKKREVVASFFILGEHIEGNEELLLQMKEDGHLIGNHTFNHPNVIGMSEEQFGKELSMVSDKFKEITGKEMTKFYRAPQGKLSFDNLKMAQKLGYKTFFWSLAYVDWNTDAQPTKEEAFSKLLTRVHPGAIVLLHNTSSTNGEILDELLEKWEDMGYKVGKLQDIK